MNNELLFDLTLALNKAGELGGAQSADIMIKGEPNKMNVVEMAKAQQRVMQAFFHTPVVTDKENKVAIQAFAGSSDLPRITTDVFNVTNAVPNYDLLWQEAFKAVPLTDNQLDWEIHDVESGVQFKLIPEGGKIEYTGMSGTKQTAYVQKYGAGTGVTWETIVGRKLYRFVDQIEQTRAALYTIWGNVHYGLVAAAGLVNQLAWQGAAEDRTLDRDILTLNTAYTDIGTRTKDSGYGDTANVQMLVYASPLLKARLNQALNTTAGILASVALGGTTGVNAGQALNANIKVLYTYNAAIPAGKAIMCLPGHKFQNAVRINELGLEKQDQDNLNTLKAYWTAFGAVAADTDQATEMAFS